MNNYYQLLKHPEWQKKRLEIMSRANFECENCGDKERMLHVHHGYYEKDRKPWEYPNETLKCLCDNCHKEAHGFKDKLKIYLGLMNHMNIPQLMGYMCGLMTESDDDEIEINFDDIHYVFGLSDYFRVNAYDILENSKKEKITLGKLRELKAKSNNRNKPCQ